MITVQIVISKNSVRYFFCSKKDYKNENMIRNKQNIVRKSCFDNVLSKTISYKNLYKKNIAKAQPRLRGQVEANQPRYYTSVAMITTTKFQQLV